MNTPDTCTWTENDDYWESQCGVSFLFNDCTTPAQNAFCFCPFCGRPIIEHPETPA